MTTVKLRPNESQEQLLKRFRKKVTKDGLMSTVRRKRWYVTKSELRRIEKKKAPMMPMARLATGVLDAHMTMTIVPHVHPATA